MEETISAALDVFVSSLNSQYMLHNCGAHTSQFIADNISYITAQLQLLVNDWRSLPVPLAPPFELSQKLRSLAGVTLSQCPQVASLIGCVALQNNQADDGVLLLLRFFRIHLEQVLSEQPNPSNYEKLSVHLGYGNTVLLRHVQLAPTNVATITCLNALLEVGCEEEEEEEEEPEYIHEEEHNPSKAHTACNLRHPWIVINLYPRWTLGCIYILLESTNVQKCRDAYFNESNPKNLLPLTAHLTTHRSCIHLVAFWMDGPYVQHNNEVEMDNTSYNHNHTSNTSCHWLTNLLTILIILPSDWTSAKRIMLAVCESHPLAVIICFYLLLLNDIIPFDKNLLLFLFERQLASAQVTMDITDHSDRNDIVVTEGLPQAINQLMDILLLVETHYPHLLDVHTKSTFIVNTCLHLLLKCCSSSVVDSLVNNYQLKFDRDNGSYSADADYVYSKLSNIKHRDTNSTTTQPSPFNSTMEEAPPPNDDDVRKSTKRKHNKSAGSNTVGGSTDPISTPKKQKLLEKLIACTPKKRGSTFTPSSQLQRQPSSGTVRLSQTLTNKALLNSSMKKKRKFASLANLNQPTQTKVEQEVTHAGDEDEDAPLAALLKKKSKIKKKNKDDDPTEKPKKHSSKEKKGKTKAKKDKKGKKPKEKKHKHKRGEA